MRKYLLRLMVVGAVFITTALACLLFSPHAFAVDKSCHHDSDAVYQPGAAPIDVWYDGQIPRWIQGCFQRIVDEQHASSPDPIAISFIYLSPESYSPSSNQTTIPTTAKALFYYSYPRDGAVPGYPTWMEMGLHVDSTSPNVISWHSDPNCLLNPTSAYCFGFLPISFQKTGLVGYNQHWISNETVTLNVGALPNYGSNICYGMRGFFHPENRQSTSDTGGNCIYVYKNPPAQSNGKITITKYGSDDSKVNACLNLLLASLGCTNDTLATQHQKVFDNLGLPAGVFQYNVSTGTSPGWRVDRIHVNQYNSAANLIANYDSSSPNSLSPVPLVSGGTTFVDVFYSNPNPSPVGAFDGLRCNASKQLQANGWAMDISNLNKKVRVGFWEGDASGPKRNLNFTLTADGLGRAAEKWNGISLNGHLFDGILPSSLQDGNTHTIYAYALGIRADGSEDGDNTFIGSKFINTADCRQIVSFYPWLQTKFGNVLAQGFVQGQQLDQAGSRPAGSTDKEATNLVIASVVAGPFCSNNLYALGTSPVGQRQGCTSGGYSVNANISAVQGALTEAWQQNGGGSNISCDPRFATKVLTTGAKVGANISPGCNNGTIYKTAASKLSDVLSSTTITDGRATIWAAPSGRVFTIDATLANGYGSYSDPKRIPNLAIFVDGDVEINSNVSQLDVSIISTGIIKSCGTNYVSGAPNCNNQLQVHGFWLANAFHFGRNYFNQADPSNNPAELFVQTGQSIAFPPPGLDQTYGGDDSLIIRREDNPRLQ